MKIRKPDGYKVPCTDCIIHFYDEDIFVSERATDLDYPMISYEEWLDIPYTKASAFFSQPKSTLNNLHCWVKCPLCDTWWNVWDLRFVSTNIEWTEKDSFRSVRELLEDHHLIIPSKHIKTEEYGVEQLWGFEEEIAE